MVRFLVVVHCLLLTIAFLGFLRAILMFFLEGLSLGAFLLVVTTLALVILLLTKLLLPRGDPADEEDEIEGCEDGEN